MSLNSVTKIGNSTFSGYTRFTLFITQITVWVINFQCLSFHEFIVPINELLSSTFSATSY